VNQQGRQSAVPGIDAFGAMANAWVAIQSMKFSQGSEKRISSSDSLV
jgi:hypothetical protein